MDIATGLKLWFITETKVCWNYMFYHIVQLLIITQLLLIIKVHCASALMYVKACVMTYCSALHLNIYSG